PSGAQGFKVWCEIPSQCYTKAAEMCPQGYNIEASEKDYWGMGDFDGNLFISCKQGAASQPMPQPEPAAPANASAPAATRSNEPDPAKRSDACKDLRLP